MCLSGNEPGCESLSSSHFHDNVQTPHSKLLCLQQYLLFSFLTAPGILNSKTLLPFLIENIMQQVEPIKHLTQLYWSLGFSLLLFLGSKYSIQILHIISLNMDWSTLLNLNLYIELYGQLLSIHSLVESTGNRDSGCIPINNSDLRSILDYIAVVNLP